MFFHSLTSKYITQDDISVRCYTFPLHTTKHNNISCRFQFHFLYQKLSLILDSLLLSSLYIFLLFILALLYKDSLTPVIEKITLYVDNKHRGAALLRFLRCCFNN